MTQEDRWLERYEEVDVIETNHRNPSRHRIEEYDMLNWLKANRKIMNAGKMKTLFQKNNSYLKRLGLAELEV